MTAQNILHILLALKQHRDNGILCILVPVRPAVQTATVILVPDTRRLAHRRTRGTANAVVPIFDIRAHSNGSCLQSCRTRWDTMEVQTKGHIRQDHLSNAEVRCDPARPTQPRHGQASFRTPVLHKRKEDCCSHPPAPCSAFLWLPSFGLAPELS